VKYTIVMLIHFTGHPKLGDHYTNTRRYSELLKFATSVNLDRDNIVFVSNQNPYREKDPGMMLPTFEILKTNGFDMIYTEDDETILEILSKVKDVKDWDIKEYNTQIIIGGTNLGGCVINSKKASAVHWRVKGYKTIIHLPLCAEYEQPGINAVEKVYRSIEQLIHFTTEYKAYGIKYCNDFHKLQFTFQTEQEGA